MLNELRMATAALHEQLEKENSANRILDHSISLEQYKELLYQNYVAYYITEKEIAGQLHDYQDFKYKSLEKDLTALDIPLVVPDAVAGNFICNSKIEALGAAYVVEGSAMGGRLIAKNIPECPQLHHIKNHHFFSGKRDSVKSWRSFTKKIQKKAFSEGEIQIAQKKAQETFLAFSAAFSQRVPV
ncbi:biliverdin-producing heme oxygenase [Zunongwangia sp. H14]|uniref:biliverdin-producing heme oxygenase n=1 Tax=Zunongwangia sp. H14 TaxID=3240792 RepID=UPI003562B8A3